MALTELQEAFAVAYAANGGKCELAAIEAGYASGSARDLGYRALRNPEVLDLVMSELMRLRARAGAVGLDVLIKVAESPSAAPAARVSAARTLLEHAGLVGPAKEVAEARERARNPDSRVIDYLEVLDNLRTLAEDVRQMPRAGYIVVPPHGELGRGARVAAADGDDDLREIHDMV